MTGARPSRFDHRRVVIPGAASRILQALVGIVASALLLAGCSAGGSAGYPVGPDAVLLNHLPAKLPQHLATDRSLDANAVASGTPADPAKVKDLLANSSFGEAYTRIWTKDQDYVTLMAVAFKQKPDASRFVKLETDEMKSSANTYVTPHKDLPGSYVFVISSLTRAGSKDVICEGVWLPDSYYAIETLTCSSGGAWATWAEELARQEADLVKHQAA